MTSTVSSSLPAGTMPSAAASEARVRASADQWKRKLLDLTKRNRALNFRATRVSTVAIVDEQPAEVFRRLVLGRQPMRFRAAPERGQAPGVLPATDRDAPAAAPPEGSAAAAALAHVPPDAALGAPRPDGAVGPAASGSAALAVPDLAAVGGGDEDDLQALDFAPYDSATLDGRHTDEWLQTALTPEALDRSLRRLDEQARSSLDEQGVNTLFLAAGMLQYTESDDSTQVLRAPLVLIPVELTRKSARAGYQLRATDDDPIVNPALAEYARRAFGVVLPELPDAGALDDRYDLQQFLRAAAEAAGLRPGWAVKTDLVLALFSFQKFVMYKDLDAHVEPIARHRLLQQLVTRQGSTGAHVVGLPNDVRRMNLDAEYPPESTSQVVDADSSQLRAIAAVARQHSLVIEGPPGTGKSQTITNLIAQALAAGKSVLFVAEKMAALSVVHDRLVRAGLGEFCLELHSTKANKRAVVQSLGAALDASLQSVAAPTASTQRLPVVRTSLGEYVQAVHTPHGAIGATPYDAYGAFGRVLTAPRATYPGPVDSVTRADLDQAERDLADLAAAAAPVGVPAAHPWRDSTQTFYTADDLDAVRGLARTLAEEVAAVQAGAAAVEAGLALPPIHTLAAVDTAVAIADVVHRSPGAPLAVLASDAWNAPPVEATRLVEQGQAVVALRDRLLGQLAPEALDHEHGDDAAYVERKSQGMFGFLAVLDGRYRAVKNRWLGWRRPGGSWALLEQVPLMRQVDRLRADRTALDSAATQGQALFGGLWQGERSDWAALQGYVRWVVEFRGICVRHGLDQQALTVASRPAPDISAVMRLRDRARAAERTLGALREAVGWPADYLGDATLADISARATALADAVLEGPRWAAFEAARRAVARGVAAWLLPAAMTGDMAMGDLAPALRRAFWLKWITGVVRARPALEQFATLTHEQRVAEFRRLDERVFLENRAALVGQLRDRTQHQLREPPAAEGMPVLRRELARQRGHAPLRRTLTQAEAAIRAIKPCWMMSPLTVAQYLVAATPGGRPPFDLVIFDEASQLPVEDAIGAVMRAAQLVVVGDPKQLPPTNFFAASIGQADVPLGEDGAPLYEDSESILEEFMGSGMPMSRLKWHYRSAHESLISFSNVSFYDAELYTFPSVETTTDAGLQFEFVDGGVYEGKGLNAVEARRVADEVVRFAKAQFERRAQGEPTQSLGVGTFNLRQQLAIQDELEQRRRDDPSIEPFFDRGVPEPFFVKNLENIQGDERDVVFLSVTYARGGDGKLRYNFGPLNGENGWRRLNVLTTRARQRMRVFASMRGDEISAAATTARGAQLLREFLLFAERGRLESTTARLAADTESFFERDVLRELRERGLTVVPQVGVAGYRIDLGVLDDAAPGRFLCGIECDGVAYHSSETARDRDRLRQQVLEARGWTIYRVWSTDWFKDRAGQIDRLLGLIGEARARAAEQRDAERATRERAAALAATRAAEEDAARRREVEALGAAPTTPYVRPTAAPYTLTPGEGRFAGTDLLTAPASQLLAAVREVVTTEGPIHEVELASRVAGLWGSRVGSRIQARIAEATLAAERDRVIARRGNFLWPRDLAPADAPVRSRTGMRMAPDRIAAEEYQAAIRAILGSGHGFSRGQLTTEVRSVLGFGRTGAALDEAIGGVIDALVADGTLGESSSGLRLRSRETRQS